MARGRGLPDHIRPGVQVLFVGINPGVRSAAVGHHFAGHSNRFWKLLYDSNLVPFPLTYEDDSRLPEFGFGITNVVDRPSRGMASLKPRDYAEGRTRLVATILRYRPRLVALLGVTLRSVVHGERRTAQSRKDTKTSGTRLGLQVRDLAGAKVFLLPNPSGRNAHYSYGDMLKVFRRLRKSIRR